MSRMATIRRPNHEDVMDAAEGLKRRCGSVVNAIAEMCRSSPMYRQGLAELSKTKKPRGKSVEPCEGVSSGPA